MNYNKLEEKNIALNNKEAELLSSNPVAPFTEEQIKTFNDLQERLSLYTCMGFNDCQKSEDHDYGVLKAEKNHLICPCGRYRYYAI